MPKFKFWSDTNRKQFEWELQRLGIPSEHDRENGYTVVVPEGYDETQLDALATGLGATIVFEEKEKADDGTGTSGLESSGFLDTGAVSARAQPPEGIADPSSQQLIANVARTIRGPFAKRRLTRGQP